MVRNLLDWSRPYNARKATNQQLADDWRLFIAAIANIESGVKGPFTTNEIVTWAVACAEEIAKRVKSGNMVYQISEERSDAYEKLWTEVVKKLETWEQSTLTGSLDSMPGLNLEQKQAEQIATGKKSVVVTQKDCAAYFGKTLILCSAGFALGTLKLKRRQKRYTRDDLGELYPEHRITSDELRTRWPEGDTFFCYDITDFSLWDTLRDAEIAKEARLYVKKVQTRDSKHRRDECMRCKAKPEYEVLWAEGIARAWFCDKHLREFVKKSAETCLKEGFFNLNCELNAIKLVEEGKLKKEWKENKNPNILNRILSEVRPDVDLKLLDKKKKKEKEEAWSKQESIGLRDSDELAPVNSSGVEIGEEITLDELKKYFKSFYRTKPYVSLVGGICNWGKTKGDIDFFINATHRDIATEFRIYRMFPKDYWHRFKFMYPTEAHPGKFTDHIDIFNEKIELITAPELVLMSSQKKEVKLFKFTKLLKPAHGRYKGEEYDIESLIKLMSTKTEWYKKGIYVQKKFDGVHVRCDVKRNYESGHDVRIWTEEGNDITSKLPTLHVELGELAGDHAIAIVGELEFWKDKGHQSRQQTTAIIHTKEVHENENKVFLNIFDVLFYDKDIHEEPYLERLKTLAKLEERSNCKKAGYRLIYSSMELRDAVKHYATQPGSEGAYLKRADFLYELDGATQLNIKYKNTFSIDAEVKEVHNVKGSETWNYLCSIKDKGRDVPIGRTYNTSIKLERGDIVKVEFVNLNKYFDDRIKKTWYNWWSPRVIMARPDKKLPDTTAIADKLVEASHGEKKNRRAKVALDADPYMTLPDENKKLLGMCHIHGRGKSVHGDLRFQVTSDYAVGWTLYIPKGLSKVPETFKEFKELVDKEIMPIIKDKLEDPTKKFNCGKKEPEPVEWLDYEGMVQKGKIGATKNEPGFFYIIDRFDVEFGTSKSHFHEYFCHGDLFDGRVVARLLENRETWKKTGEGMMTWMCSTALTDKTPYVLSSRAVNQKWIPPYRHSALPADVRASIPAAGKYWEEKDPKRRREIRDELIVKIKTRKSELKLDVVGPASYKVLRQTWKGQKVIREGASRTVYYFVICQNGKGQFGLVFQNNPQNNIELTGLIAKEINALCAIKDEKDIKPGTALNPTRETPSTITVMENGNAISLGASNFKRYRIKGGKMKGEWHAYNREDGSVMWSLRRVDTEEGEEGNEKDSIRPEVS